MVLRRPDGEPRAGAPQGAERAQLIERTLAQYRRYLNPGLARLFQFGGVETVEWAAEGCLVWDVHGREYIDWACGQAIFNIGHRHARFLAAERAQHDSSLLSAIT